MTKEEARDKYGDFSYSERGYVWCRSCPVREGCELKRMPTTTGYDDCWEYIAEHMSEPDNSETVSDPLDKKRDEIFDYCFATGCNKCKLNNQEWDKPLGEYNECLDIAEATERDIEKALSLIKEDKEDSNSIIPTENDVIKPNDDVIKPNENANEPIDLINHPPHYTHGGMECIDEMILIFGKEAVMNFCLCNAWKYRKRAPYKGTSEQDMDKSNWYLNKYKELKEGVSNG